MNWPAFFLGCFVVGFALERAVVRARARSGVHVHVHLPFVHHPVSPARARRVGRRRRRIGPVNFATVMAFLAWFGGTGYLLTSQFRWLAMPALVLADAGRRRRRLRRVLGDGARAVVAEREHAERGLSDGRRARSNRPFDSRRRHRRADLFARRHAAFLRRPQRRRPRDRARGGSGGDGLRPRHRLRAAMGRISRLSQSQGGGV